jgi:histidyl-tRNA synthetase
LPQPEVMIVHLGEQPKEVALQVANEMRLSGIRTQTSFGNHSLRSQLRRAGREGVAYTLILGEDEVRSDQVAVKDMASGEQELVPRELLPGWMGAHLRRG